MITSFERHPMQVSSKSSQEGSIMAWWLANSSIPSGGVNPGLAKTCEFNKPKLTNKTNLRFIMSILRFFGGKKIEIN